MPKNPFDLSGRVAVITGGGTGLGRGMADGLARAQVRAVLDAAVEPLRADYRLLAMTGSNSNSQARDLVAAIALVGKATGDLGGSGAYWLALRVFLGVDRP